MPFPLDAETEADIASGKVRSADLIDLYVRDGDGNPATQRCWNWIGPASYPGTADLDGDTSNQTYESMYGRVRIAKGLRMAASLSSEPLVITLDGSRSGDDEDWVGRFVDSQFHQCRVRVRCVMISRATNAFRSQPHWEWRGLIDHPNLTLQEGQAASWEVKCQGGLFRVRGRRLTTRSQEDQQRRSAGDKFYIGTAKMVGLPLNWAKAPANIPGLHTVGGSPTYNPITGRPLFAAAQN